MDKKDFLIVILFLALILSISFQKFLSRQQITDRQPTAENFENYTGASVIKTESKYNSDNIHNGYLCSKIEDFDCLINESSKAIEIDPEEALAYSNRAFGYLRTGKLVMAEKDLAKALSLNPTHTLALNNRGLLRILQKKYDLAIMDIEKAEKYEPTIPEIYLNKGLIFSGKLQYLKAIEQFNKAIELNPKSAIAFEERGKAYKKIDKYKDAEDDLLKAENIRKNY